MNTKKLKQLVLDLAIHGKLVPQDPNDEPASELLKRIVETHGRASNKSKGKKSAISSEEIDEVPFEVPEGWVWTTIGNVGEVITGTTPSKDIEEYYGGDIPFFKPSDLEQGINTFFSSDSLTEKGYNVARQLPRNSILVTCIGATIGKTGIIRIDGSCNQQINAIIPNKLAYSEYIYYVIISGYFQNEIKDNASATTLPILNKNTFSSLLFPLPPLSEQKRIVSAIEKWFGIIDQLESNEADLRKSIEQTKKKVLDLAIHGKLVPQDPNDEPASELLKRIVETRGRASNIGRASNKSKGKKSAISSEEIDEVPFEVPEGWVWCRLGEISVDSADGPFGSNLKKEHYTDKQEVRIVQLSNIGELNWRDDNVKYTTFEHLKVISRSEVFPGDIIIAKMMPAGRAIICPSKERKYVLSSDAVKFSFSNLVYNKYLFYSINSSVFKEQVYDNVQGVTRVRTSLVKLREYLVPLPPLSEQKRIVAKIEDVFGALDRIEEMIG